MYMILGNDEYREKLFDAFENKDVVDVIVDTPEQEKNKKVEKIKDNIKAQKSKKEMIDDAYDKSLDVLDTLQNKSDEMGEKLAKKIVPSPRYRAFKDHRLIPTSVDYITYNQQIKRAKQIMGKISPLFYTFLYITLPLTFEATGVILAKTLVVDNVPFYKKFIKGELTEDEIKDRYQDICKDVRKIHHEVGDLVSKFEKLNVGFTIRAMKMFKRSEKELGKAVDKTEATPNKVSVGILASVVKALCKKYDAVCKLIRKEEKKEDKGKSKDEVVKESVFDKEEMDIITQLKFAVFENAEDNNPYDLLDELVEKCNYDNDDDYEKLMDAFEYVLNLDM